MTVMVALLRGVNVGGKNTLAMAQLRDIASACGHTDVATYIQSGNVVFSTSRRGGGPVARELAAAITDETGLTPSVMVRTRSELRKVVDDNPFLQRGEDPGYLHVVFLDAKPPVSAGLEDPDAFVPEEVAPGRRELYLLLPSGVGRSPLAIELGRGAAKAGTMRNWRTVTKLLAMADEIA